MTKEMKKLIKSIDAKIKYLHDNYSHDKNRVYWQASGLHDAKEIIKSESRTDEIMGEIYTAMEKIGAKSDLLGIIGSYGDTMSDADVLDALKSFNNEPSTQLPDRRTNSSP